MCFTALFLAACSGSKVISISKQSTLVERDFLEVLPFRYEDKHIFVDIIINGKSYNFLFDTGWEISSISAEVAKAINFNPKVKYSISGSSIAKHKTQFGTIAELNLGNLTFRNSGAGIEDLSFIECSRKVDGILGINLISKANLQIDYENQLLKFADNISKFELDQAFEVEIKSRGTGWGYFTTNLILEEYTLPFVIDTGSSGRITTQQSTIPSIQANSKVDISLGNLHLENQTISIEKKVANLIGNRFLENYLVTFDWQQGKLYLQ